jgi:crotonobetainyl-CoA:carnitine CoA-transferase CaiB-like acyl-CoA transferase
VTLELRPLRGIRIIDLSRYAPGPYCSLVLAALGAEVIRVESPSAGDPLRALDPEAFERLNAGKRSAALDLKAPGGAEALRRMAVTAGALVEGFRPGVMARLGLDYESLRVSCPSLIYVSITGYGQEGPYRDRAGHDVNYMAVSGALDGMEMPLAMQVADFAAGGLFAATAILAALLERKETQSGFHFDLAMHHGLLSLMLLSSGTAAERLSGRGPNYGVYRTRDGRFVSVGALEPQFWQAFCEGIERPDLEGRIDDPEARAEVAKVIEAKDLSYWNQRFARRDACVEAVSSPEAARTHPQAVHRSCDGDAFTLPFLPGSALRLSRAPSLGEHTAEILVGLGYSREEIAALRARGVC